ncbi:MAG: crossover junction endodeoxyribonuclease RuvC [bacterium]|nr:crossover junction endodeoxyribonuclease RuvC [bacterium]
MTPEDVILGVDPGLGTTGWGVIRVTPRGPTYVESGKIRTDSKRPIGERLKKIFETLQSTAREQRATAAAVEGGFVGRSALSALQLGQARAAAVLALELGGLPVRVLSPREVKLAVTGRGSAAKEQVGFMVGRILGLEFDRGEDDISDALAVALCLALHGGAAKASGAR